mgnify:CR=1 FL=1
MKPRAMKKMKDGGSSTKDDLKKDPPWLRALKKEADKLGVPLRELMTMYEKGRDPKKAVKTMTAAKGGVAKKKMMRGGAASKKTPMRGGGMGMPKKPMMRGGGMGKKKMMRGGMSKKKK